MSTTYTLTDRDLRMLLQEAPYTRSFVKRLATYALITTLFAGVAFGALAYLTQPSTTTAGTPAVLSTAAAQPIADAQATPVPTPAAPTPTPLPVTIPNNTITVSGVKISAPIIWNVGYSDKEMNSALEKGVMHITGTAVPGQKGMSAIAGHSSNYYWAKGQFNSIFAPLTKVKPDQEIQVNYEGVMYKYVVRKVYEVKPDDVQILNQNDMTGIRLITCTPVGTSLRRLIVEAEQVFPDPAYAAPFNGAQFQGSIPGQ